MAAASDKARFYLERYVPELQEYQRKGLFTREEIIAITSKRSDFEHIINARGSQPGDYARYATYEMNLDALRKKRCTRMGIKTTTFNGQRTVFFVLDRATKKFSGNLSLWMQYINYCKKEKAHKKLAKVFTSVLRLHPSNWSLWVLAAKHYAETQGDMGTARSYMQRGLRFCKTEPNLYLEYARLEMIYLAKLAARRKILGLDETRAQQREEDENTMALPVITAEDMDPTLRDAAGEETTGILQQMSSAPAFSGAIPIAIFDVALKQVSGSPLKFAEDFFDLVSTFDDVPCSSNVLLHIKQSLQDLAPNSVEAAICDARFQLFGVPVTDPEFPAALGKALYCIKGEISVATGGSQELLAEKTIRLLLPYLDDSQDIDQDVIRVVEAAIKRQLHKLLQAPDGQGSKGMIASHQTIQKLQDEDNPARRRTLARLAGRIGPFE